jgi:hypothetical protein
MAKRAPNAPVITNASIIAQPLNDSSLGPGKTDDSKPATDNANNPGSGGPPDQKAGTSANESTPKTEENVAAPTAAPNPSPGPGSTGTAPQENKTAESQTPAKTDQAKAKSTSQDQSANPAPQKKKSRFHVLKKIVPF